MTEVFTLVTDQTDKTDLSKVEVDIFETRVVELGRVSRNSLISQIQGHQDEITKLQKRLLAVEAEILKYELKTE